ncbi:MAG: phytanoyl-CoA dioxygenase family protein [Chthonomonadales bacterium]
MLEEFEIECFHAAGFTILRGLISGNDLDLLLAAADRVVEEGVARQGSDHKYLAGPDGKEVYWRSENMWQRDPIFQAVTANPLLLEAIGQCIGEPFYPWNDSLVVKLPLVGAAVPWHQDPPYRNPDRLQTYPTPNFTTDIYLDHSDEENGCVYAIPGKHLDGHIDLTVKANEEWFNAEEAVPIVMEPGDVLFHALSTPHGSQVNTSDRIRRVFYVHYLAEQVYQDGYASEPWAMEIPGWSQARHDAAQAMVSARESLGLSSAAGSHVVLTDDGYVLTTGPTSEKSQWSKLSRLFSEIP